MSSQWLRACVAAETVGMTAAAAAARAATWLTDERGLGRGWGLAVVVAGGLVEGTALGVFQARVLRPRVGADPARRWAVATTVVAGLAWAAGAAPATLGSGGGTGPALPLVMLGGAGLGVVTGAVLGAAQAAAARRGRRASPRWVAASSLGWGAAMPVIFLGAGLPSADWSAWAVVPLGSLTGALAGAVLGLLTAGAAVTLAEGPGTGGPKVPSDGEVRPWEQGLARS